MNDYDFSGYDPSGFSGQDYGGYDIGGYDDYGAYNDYVSQPDYSGYTGLDYTGGEPTYGGDVGAYGNVDQPIDRGQSGNYGSFTGLDYSGGQVNPEAELAMRGGYTAPGEGGFLARLYNQLKDKATANPLTTIAGLGTFGAGLYSSMQENKQREALAKELRDAKAARAARLAKYGAVLPMKLNRQQLAPPSDLLTAGQRSGGINWFTPTTFTNMADGGEVRDKRGFLSRMIGPSLLPDVPIGPRNPMEALALKKYALYKMQQEENSEPYIDYGRWTDRGMRGMARGGLSSLVEGDGGGQDDKVPINASSGEYIFSAQDVSDIGDGDNAEGARRLDEMRMRLRSHKQRSKDLAPMAKEPASYLEGE